MFDAIFVGTSGLQAFSAGLKVISNNIANLNTPGFKASDSVFANLYYSGSGTGQLHSDSAGPSFGSGVAMSQTFVDFKNGELRQTGNPLDLSINGDGFFITQAKTSDPAVYTRNGQFEFDRNGALVARGTDHHVMGLATGGNLVPITLDGLRLSAPKATTAVKLSGNLSSSATDFSLPSVKVIDALGGEHTLKLSFAPKAGSTGVWLVKVTDGSLDVGNGEIQFNAGTPSPLADAITLTYAPSGVAATSLKLDFSSNVTSFDTGSVSTLAVTSTDGYAVGTLTQVTFDADGVMRLTYANGQVANGPKVALARFDANTELTPQGNSNFRHDARQGVHIGQANQSGFGSVGSNQFEGSNVDLAAEFSGLIVAQRGYQASSRIVSTANELLQDLFDMKGHR